MGVRRTRRRRQAGPSPRGPAIRSLGTPTPADDPGELVIRTTPDGRYTYVSPAVRRMLGYEPDELLAQAPFETVHPDDLTPNRSMRTSPSRRDGDVRTVSSS